LGALRKHYFRVWEGEKPAMKPDASSRFTAAGPIFYVPLNGKTRCGKLGANLMMFPGKKFYFQKKVPIP